jgi:tetratricopeptide (TPR) repeat protein
LHLFAGRILFFLRDYDGAIAYFTTTLELQPTSAIAHEHFGDACEGKGMLHEAITQWYASLTLGGQSEQAQFLEQAFAASGFDAAVRALAQRQLQHLNERSARGEYVPAWNYLTAYLRWGDKEQALVWLAKAVEEPNWFALQLKINPLLDPLRSDPRFEKIVADLPAK